MKNITLAEISLNVLKELKKIGKSIQAKNLCSKLGLEYEILMTQAVYGLQQNGLASYTEEYVTELVASSELKSYINNGLPERQVTNRITN